MMSQWVKLSTTIAQKKNTRSETIVLSPLPILDYRGKAIPPISYKEQIIGAAKYLSGGRHQVRNLLIPIKWAASDLEYWALVWIPTAGELCFKLMTPYGQLGNRRIRVLLEYLPTFRNIAN